MYFNKNLVIDYENYAGAEEFRSICDFLTKQRIVLRKPGRLIPFERRAFEKLNWRPGDYDINFTVDKKGQKKVYATLALHQGIHYLIAKKFGAELEGRPRYTLLMESIASCLDIFFALTYFRASGQNHPFVLFYCFAQKPYVKQSEVLSFLKSCEDPPFEVFKRFTLEMFRLLEIYLVWCSIENPSASQLSAMRRDLKKLKFRKWYKQYQHEVFMLNVLGLCGNKSTVGDRKAALSLHQILQKSRSMSEFLAALSEVQNDPF